MFMLSYVWGYEVTNYSDLSFTSATHKNWWERRIIQDKPQKIWGDRSSLKLIFCLKFSLKYSKRILKNFSFIHQEKEVTSSDNNSPTPRAEFEQNKENLFAYSWRSFNLFLNFNVMVRAWNREFMILVLLTAD